MRQPSPFRSRRLTVALAATVLVGAVFVSSGLAGVASAAEAKSATTTVPAPPATEVTTHEGHAIAAVAERKRVMPITPTTTAPASTEKRTVKPTLKATAPKAPARAFATGNDQLNALLATLPAVLFQADPTVHFGYNPLDTCCHAGGYNPGPNDVWVSQHALGSTAKLTYVTVHELGHSLHLHSTLGPALTAAVAGAPVVRAGSPWDVSEKVADCVAWVLYPAQTAASGLTYWSCPSPWRDQVRSALK